MPLSCCRGQSRCSRPEQEGSGTLWPPSLLVSSVGTQKDPLRPATELCLDLQIPLEVFLHKGVPCKSFARLGWGFVASRLFEISGNAGCQEVVNAIEWETEIDVFPSSLYMSW